MELLERIDPAAGAHVPRRELWMLGLGAFGLAWSLTTVAAYLPPVLMRGAALGLALVLGRPVQVSSALLGAVAAGYLAAAAFAGRLGDRFGLARTILVAAALYGVGALRGRRAAHLALELPGGDLRRRDRGRHGDDGLVTEQIVDSGRRSVDARRRTRAQQ